MKYYLLHTFKVHFFDNGIVCDTRPTLIFSADAGTYYAYPRKDGQAELTRLLLIPTLNELDVK